MISLVKDVNAVNLAGTEKIELPSLVHSVFVHAKLTILTRIKK